MQVQDSPEIVDLTTKPVGYYENNRPEMLNYLPENAKVVLDAGCAVGGFGAAVKEKFNAEVWGLELDVDSSKIASSRLDKVIQGDIAQTISQLPENKFDAIVFNDVLEHLVNPYDILTQLKKNLTSEGVIVCSIPNARYWRVFKQYVFGKNWKYVEDGVMDKTHLRFFTKRSIYEMFDALGYKVLETKGLKPTPSVGFLIFNLLTFGRIQDCKFIQYVFVVKVK